MKLPVKSLPTLAQDIEDVLILLDLIIAVINVVRATFENIFDLLVGDSSN